MEEEFVTHPFAPIYDASSEFIILGSFPSVKSRQTQFYYGHPGNRFWAVIAALTGEEVPVSVESKRRLLLKHHIAVWDVIASCRIVGSSDSSIRDVVVNDFSQIISDVPEIRFYANGAKAYSLYQKYAYPVTGRAAVRLPSTSPANAACSFTRLCEEWGRLLPVR